MKFIIFLIFIVILAACKNTKKEETTLAETNANQIKLTPAQFSNTRILIGKAETKNIASILKVNGKIDVPPQNLVSISAPMGGYLRSTKLLPGMHVNRGDLLATLEDQQYIDIQQQYLNSKIQLAVLQKDFQRQKELNAAKATSDKVLEQVKAEMEVQRVILKSNEQKLQMMGISVNSLNANNISRSIGVRSPINGFVSKVNVNIGKYVSANEVLFSLINPNDIHLNLQIFEKDVNSLRVGQSLICYTPSMPEKKYKCSIILISKDVNENKTIDVHCHFDQYDKDLIPGMYLSAELEANSATSLAVPETAVVQFESKNYIFLAKGNNTFELCEVNLGEIENGYIHIAGPDSVDFYNSNIVLNDAYTLLMKMKNTEE